MVRFLKTARTFLTSSKTIFAVLILLFFILGIKFKELVLLIDSKRFHPKYDISKSLLVYSKCLGENSYSSCEIYVNNLNDRENTLTSVSKFIYDRSNAIGNYGGLSLIGAIDKNIVFTDNFYDKKPSPNVYKDKTTMGFIDLKTGKKTIIEEFDRYSKIKDNKEKKTDNALLNVLTDNNNKKIYYQTRSVSGPGGEDGEWWKKSNVIEKNEIKEYDFKTGKIKILANNSILGKEPHTMYITTNDKHNIYLKNSVDYCQIKKIGKIDIATNKFTKIDKNIFELISNKKGDRLAYIIKEDKGNLFNLKLIIADSIGRNEKVIDSINNDSIKYVPFYKNIKNCDFKETFENLTFSYLGKSLLYTKSKGWTERNKDVFVWVSGFQGSEIYKLNTDYGLDNYNFPVAAEIEDPMNEKFIYKRNNTTYLTSLNFNWENKIADLAVNSNTINFDSQDSLIIP